jgi:hypothetical protein
MRRALAAGLVVAVAAVAAPAQAADPQPRDVREVAKRVTALEKRAAAVAARRGARGPTGLAGAVGAKGPVGDPGSPGATGPPGVFGGGEFSPAGSLTATPQAIVAVPLSGTFQETFLFRANAVFTNTAAQAATVTCRLKVPPVMSNTFDFAQATLGPAGGQDTRTLSLTGGWNIGAQTAASPTLECVADGVAAGSVTFSDADIVAIRLDALTGDTNRPPL